MTCLISLFFPPPEPIPDPGCAADSWWFIHVYA